MAEIDDQGGVIRELNEALVGTKEIYEVLEKDGKGLREEGKSKVSMGFVVCVGACRRYDPSSPSYLKPFMFRGLSHISKKKRG